MRSPSVRPTASVASKGTTSCTQVGLHSPVTRRLCSVGHTVAKQTGEFLIVHVQGSLFLFQSVLFSLKDDKHDCDAHFDGLCFTTWIFSYRDIRCTGKLEEHTPRGGGLCIFVNNSWCTKSKEVSRFCSPEVEHIVINCSPHYLPREFSAILFVAVLFTTTDRCWH